MFNKVTPAVDFPALEKEILEFWREKDVFRRSLETTAGMPPFVFYEGPPTANGRPHAGHVLTRVIKDLVPRYRTMCGHHVHRKAGWDTHGLPVELEVEKELGISGKGQIEDFGVRDFIERCRESVLRYEQEWRRMTERVGFWIDMDDPYITYANSYVESVWWALRRIWDRGLLYQGHKVVPYCPRCATSLSSHEVAQGYAEAEDPSVYVRFRLLDQPGVSLLVWTTTPWTLPANMAAAVHPDHRYVTVEVGGERLILAESLVEKVFSEDGGARIVEGRPGRELIGLAYEPLFPYYTGEGQGKAFRVVAGDFVSLEDGTGIVHIAPAFGEDDLRVGQANDLPVPQPVDENGRFTGAVPDFEGIFVKEADPAIIEHLRDRNRLYRAETITHTYPFCWRCETPLLYYAKTSWFIRTTAVKERLLELNEEIGWYPDHIKHGRFGDFLQNLVDWCLSRERYWGTPLNIWVCPDCGKRHCVESVAELRGLGAELPEPIDLHKPYLDQVAFPCPESGCGGRMRRVPEVIDCWFDSGAMPFAQWHYPFENREIFDRSYPADFISEAIDQTRGWFYSLLVISTLIFDRSPYRNVVSLGHVLDEQGAKMSKHKGNVVDPGGIFERQGADALRWYLYTASPPWNPTRFFEGAVSEAQRRFLLTLWNTYSFFVLYANIDGFDPARDPVAFEERPPIDRWIISRLQGTTEFVRSNLDCYNITQAARELESFVDDLSNWYIRRCRRRFWKSEQDRDKSAAYHTLYEVLLALVKLLAPFTPFISEAVYRNLAAGLNGRTPESVHLTSYPVPDPSLRDQALEREMAIARTVVSLGRAARNRVRIRNRQPLPEVVVSTSNGGDEALAGLKHLILEELNVKEIRVARAGEELASYTLKPRYDLLGPRYGKETPAIARALKDVDPALAAASLRRGEPLTLEIDGRALALAPDEVELRRDDREGYASEEGEGYTVALNLSITPELQREGLIRELVHRIQTMRKDAGLEIEEPIKIWCEGDPEITEAVQEHAGYIMQETIARELELGPAPDPLLRTEAVLGDLSYTISIARL